MITQAISAGICLASSFAFVPTPFPPQTQAAFALPKLDLCTTGMRGPMPRKGATIAHNIELAIGGQKALSAVVVCKDDLPQSSQFGSRGLSTVMRSA